MMRHWRWLVLLGMVSATAFAQQAKKGIVAEGGGVNDRASARVLYWNRDANAAAAIFNANPDFLRVLGKDGNGTELPIGPMLVWEQLPDSNPIKKVAEGYVTAYEAKYGPGTRATFGGHAYDSYLLLTKAIPVALQRAKPGTPEFRAALRDALETTSVVGTNGVFNMSPQDHNGLDNRARVMIRIENGKWVLAE